MTILYVYIVQTLDHLTYSVVLLITAAIKMSFVWCRTQTVGFNQIFDLNDLLQTSSRIYIIKCHKKKIMWEVSAFSIINRRMLYHFYIASS